VLQYALKNRGFGVVLNSYIEIILGLKKEDSNVRNWLITKGMLKEIMRRGHKAGEIEKPLTSLIYSISRITRLREDGELEVKEGYRIKPTEELISSDWIIDGEKFLNCLAEREVEKVHAIEALGNLSDEVINIFVGLSDT
jgi:hypothetical protein